MKRLLKAVLWIVCYGGACWFGIKTKLGFDILNKNNWEILFDKSVHQMWPAEMAPKKMVCKILLAFIIVGILGLSVVIRKKKTRIPVVKGELPDKGNSRPALMPSQGRIENPVTIPKNIASAPVPTGNSISDIIHQLTETAKTFDVSIFPHVKLENTFTQLVISDDTTALLLKILPQSGIWQVEQTALPQESLWKSGTEQPQPLLKDIMESTATLARLEPEANAISVIILANSTLQNPEKIRHYLAEQGIRIVTLKKQVMPDIPAWEELLAEFYPPKEREEKNETNANSQNI